MVVHHFLEAFEESAIEPSLEGSSTNGRKEERKNVGVQKAWILCFTRMELLEDRVRPGRHEGGWREALKKTERPLTYPVS